MPTDGDFNGLLTMGGILNNSAGSSKIRGVPYNFVSAGVIDGGAIKYAGAEGDLWSKTAFDATQTYYFVFDNKSVYVGKYGHRYFGFSIRCIAP